MYARRQQRYAMPRNKILSMLFHLFCIFSMVYSHAISPLALACSPDVPVAFCCLSFPIVPGSRVTIPVTPGWLPALLRGEQPTTMEMEMEMERTSATSS